MYTFIVNPNARTGLGLKTWEELETILKEKNLDYEVYMTRYPEHATEFAAEVTSRNEEVTLIALGGDGTINEVVNGIRDLGKVTFGYIPIGSSNDFVRSMGLSMEPKEMLAQILSPSKYTYINIGKVVCREKTRRFIVSCGIGFDADVCFHNLSSPVKKLLNKLKLGKLSYTGVALVLLLKLSPKPMTLTLDGVTHSFQRVFFTTAMNQRYEGGGFKFCPAADPSDDRLDMITIADMPKIKALLLLPTAFKGWHIHFKGVHTYTCKEAHITSDAVLPVHTDGEAFVKTDEISCSLEPEKLRLICG